MGLTPEQNLRRAVETAAESTLHHAFKSWMDLIESIGDNPNPAILRKQLRMVLGRVNSRLKTEGGIGLLDDLLDNANSPIKQVTTGDPFSWKEFYFDPSSHEARIHRHEEILPPVEGYLFGLLVQSKGKVVPFSLFRYDPVNKFESRTNEAVRTNIHRILDKFPYSRDPKHIINVARVGYRLESCNPD